MTLDLLYPEPVQKKIRKLPNRIQESKSRILQKSAVDLIWHSTQRLALAHRKPSEIRHLRQNVQLVWLNENKFLVGSVNLVGFMHFHKDTDPPSLTNASWLARSPTRIGQVHSKVSKRMSPDYFLPAWRFPLSSYRNLHNHLIKLKMIKLSLKCKTSCNVATRYPQLRCHTGTFRHWLVCEGKDLGTGSVSQLLRGMVTSWSLFQRFSTSLILRMLTHMVA